MALIVCPECKDTVSEFAATCPKCAAPIARMTGNAGPVKKPRNPWMIIGWIVLLIILLPLATCTLLFGGMVGGTASDAYSDYQQRAQDAQQGK